MAARNVGTLVVGGGQAGLAASRELQKRGRPHVVLERNAIGHTWLAERWDSFCLVTPNWTVRLPDRPYAGPDPDGFMPRDEVVSYLRDYASHFGLPVEEGVAVDSVRPGPGPGSPRFVATTSAGTIHADHVIVAAGAFPTPNLPAPSARIPAGVVQIHTNQYRNPQSLPPGAVLVVGTGQSGAQVADELATAGRRVYVATCTCGRAFRKYRGKDFVWWMEELGRTSRPIGSMPDPAAARRACKPHLSGQRGGYEIDLRTFPARGATLLGRFLDADGPVLRFAPDLNANLAKADQFARSLVLDADRLVAERGLPFPADPRRAHIMAAGPHPELPEVTEVDLGKEGITAIVWATGFRPRFPWVEAPVFDADGAPLHERGVTAVPGLYFLGLPWLHTHKSDALFGVGDDAAYVVRHLDAEAGPPEPPRGRATTVA